MIPEIKKKILARRYELSRHAVDQSIRRDIRIAELEEAFLGTCDLVEDYPEDTYGPSCLILGFTKAMRPLHILVSYPSRPVLKIITLYEPDPAEWIDHRLRKAGLDSATQQVPPS